MQGLRDLLQQLRQQRRQQLDRFDLSSVFDDIKRQLEEIVAMEKNTLDRRLDEVDGQQPAGWPAPGRRSRGSSSPGATAGRAAAAGQQGNSSAANRASSSAGSSSRAAAAGQRRQQQGGQQQGGGEGSSPTSSPRCCGTSPNKKKHFLEQLPEDVAGQVKELQNYEFMDPEAQAALQRAPGMPEEGDDGDLLQGHVQPDRQHVAGRPGSA